MMRSCMTRAPHKILLGCQKKEGKMWHVWDRREMEELPWGLNMKKRGRKKDVGIDAIILLKRILKKEDGQMWTRFRLERSGGLL
jgi:hypothetical protein